MNIKLHEICLTGSEASCAENRRWKLFRVISA